MTSSLSGVEERELTGSEDGGRRDYALPFSMGTLWSLERG